MVRVARLGLGGIETERLEHYWWCRHYQRLRAKTVYIGIEDGVIRPGH